MKALILAVVGCIAVIGTAATAASKQASALRAKLP
jgi:hypothetical protein